MRMFYLTKKECTQCAIGILLLLSIGYLLGDWWYKNISIPTIEVSPIYQGCGEKKQVSLAVNIDWGEEYLPEMLGIFEKNHVQATFFLTGRWTEKFPGYAASIAKEGHEIGNHGFSHGSPNAMSKEQNKNEIQKTADAIKKATGRETGLYAPPSGESASHVVQAAYELGHKTVLWSVDTIDWQRPAPQRIVQRVVSKVHNGTIILMHPTAPTVEALPQLINDLKNQGYTLVTVSKNIED